MAAAAAAARRTDGRGTAPRAAAGGAADEQLLSALMGQSARQEACLAERLASLRLPVSYWEAGDVKKMLQHLQRIDDPSVAVDIVNAGVLTGGRLDLECAFVVLPLLDSLLGSTYEEHTARRASGRLAGRRKLWAAHPQHAGARTRHARRRPERGGAAAALPGVLRAAGRDGAKAAPARGRQGQGQVRGEVAARRVEEWGGPRLLIRAR